MLVPLNDFSNKISQHLKSISQSCQNLKDESLLSSQKLSPLVFDFSVIATDGGILYERLFGFDLFLLRSSCVYFNYNENKLIDFEYFPSKLSPITPLLLDSFDENESQKLKSLLRLKEELSITLNCAKEKLPKIVLLDGSIVPLPSDRPEKSSSLFPLFEEIISLYAQLYLFCSKNNLLLCAIVKDSRSKSISSRFDLNFNDVVLFDNLLDGNSASSLFDLTEKFGFSDFSFKFFYLKPTSSSLPLRVEFLSLDFDFDIIPTINSLCQLGLDYPPPLIEADLCATIDPNEIENFKKSLPLELRPLRRNSRLFR